jgi:hypothetical protein
MVTAKRVQYSLRRVAPGKLRHVNIRERTFTAVRTANTGLAVVLNLEEKLEFVLGNYTEYENELLHLAVDNLVWARREWSQHRVAKQIVNRRVINLLSTTRMYLDQVQHDLGVFGADASAASAVKAASNAEYDSSFAFRVMEALRNHVQHRDLPVHQLTFPLLFDFDVEPMTRRQTAVPVLNPARLTSDRHFKAPVLKELLARGSQVPLTPLIRDYVAAITRVHSVLRQVTDAAVAEWDATIDGARKYARRVLGGDLDGVLLIAEHPGEAMVRSYVFDELALERRALRARTRKLDDLAQSYVASEPPEADKRHSRRTAG